MAGLFERMGLVRTEYEGMPEIPMQPVSEPILNWRSHRRRWRSLRCSTI